MQTERSPKGSSEGVDAEGQICCHCWIGASSGLNSRLQQWRNKNFQRPGTEAPRFFEGWRAHVQGLNIHAKCFAVE